MKKTQYGVSPDTHRVLIKYLLMTKLVILLIFAFSTQGFARTYGQGISLNLERVHLKKVLKTIEQQGDFRFVYKDQLLKGNQLVSIEVANASLDEVLSRVLENTKLTYRRMSDHLVVIAGNEPADQLLLAQKAIVVTGKVTGETGDPLAGVSVIEKTTNNGTFTAADGAFSIEVSSASAVLVFSYIGFKSTEVSVNDRTELGSIIMTPDVTSMSDIVVVGYGSVRKKDLTSSVVTVTSKDFLPGAVNSPMQMIDGKVAGLTVSNPAAADPNRGTDVQVRGAGSFRAGNGPLIIIDGVPGGDLRNIAQQDIESITVLKDAASAAIYGSRGAGGVILVQTKRGKAGKVSLTYDSYIEHDAVAAKPNILSAEEFLSHNRDVDLGSRTNWYDELIRENNFGQNHFLSISGGNENSVFRISGNYRTKQGIDIATDRKESGLRANFLQKAIDGLLEISGNVSYRTANEEYTNYGAFKQAVKLNPTIAIMDADDPTRYNTLQGFDTYNPVQDLKARENGADQTYSIVDLNFKLNITKDLNTEVKLARQGHDMLRREYYNGKSAESVNNGYIGRARLQSEKWLDYTLEWLGNYAKRIDRHDLRVVAGYSYQEFNNQGFWSQNRRFPSDAFSYNNIGAGNYGNGQAINMTDVMGSWKSKEKNIAFLGRANYNFDDTYFLTVSARYEGNTKFGADNKWGLFPSASAAWRISNLPAFQSISAINDLKVRFSYGVTGRSGFDRYTSLAKYQGYGRYQNDDGQWIQVYGPGNNYNPDLRWEKQIAYNLGVDFGLFNNRLSGSIDAFLRKGSDLINDYLVPVPPYLHDRMFVNVGTQSNRGIELTLNWNAIQGKDFSYTTNVTGSYIKSKMDKFSNDKFKADRRFMGDLPSPGNPGPAYLLREGTEIGSFWGYKYAGVDDEGKILIWKDAVVGKEAIVASSDADAERDKTFIGNGMPRYELAWGNTFTYKAFDLALFFRGRFDYEIINLYQMYFGLQAEPNVNLLQDAYTRNGQITSGKVITDYFLESGDYFKLDNLTLGWSPAIGNSKVKSLRIYATVRNVFTITKYTGLDPTTVSVTGLTPGFGSLDVYPIARNFSLGAQITF